MLETASAVDETIMQKKEHLIDNHTSEGVDRLQILPQSLRDYGKELAADPAKARSFLQRTGLIDESGQLHPSYRDKTQRSVLY